jgi:DNA adenine methylase
VLIADKQNLNRNSAINSKSAHPFLKWAGGKSQLVKHFKSLYPVELKSGKIKNYFEPFLGGGAVFFDIAQKYRIDAATLFDINEEIVLVYNVIQKDVFSLLEYLEKFQCDFQETDKHDKQAKYFYSIREKFNVQKGRINFNHYSKKWIKRAAYMIFLNKTCYNGLFRVNLKGEFNVPFGRNINPTINDAVNLINVSKMLSIAEIRFDSFENIVERIKRNSFVYFDPPYRPLNKTSSFTSYSTFMFDDSQQIRLAEVFKKADKKGAKLMLSNSDPKNTNPEDNFFEELYKGYNITRVPATRMVNSNSSKRGPVNELVIRNY